MIGDHHVSTDDETERIFMGSIDKRWVKLGCETCETLEVGSALDKGSGWSGSHWRTFGPFEKFEAQTSGGGKKDPDVISATCKACGRAASIETAYGFSRPDGF